MAFQSENNFGPGEIRCVLLACVGGVALLLWLGNQPRPAAAPTPTPVAINFQGNYHGLPNPMEANPQRNETALKQMAERTGGDYSRLTADEKTWIDAIGGGMGSQVLLNEAMLLETRRKKTRRAVSSSGRSL